MSEHVSTIELDELRTANERLKREINNRTLAEEQLRRSEKLLLEIVGALPFSVWLTNAAETEVLFVNASYEKIWGRSDHSLSERPKSWLDAVHPDEVAGVLAKLDARMPGEAASLEYRMWRPDGSVRLIRHFNFSIQDESGLVYGIVNMAEDITARSNWETRVRQAEKMDAVGRLAGGVAHDLNNLLTIVMGYSDMAVARLAPDDPLRSSLEHIRRAGDRASALSRKLLAFSRRQVLIPIVVDLNALLTKMGKRLGELAGPSVQLTIAAEPDLCKVNVDPAQIEQVITDLVANARDAMPRGGKLTIETANAQLDIGFAEFHPQNQPGRYVLLAVTDAGCGMDAATQARVFEPFFTTKEPDKGKGLGLATVYGTVTQSGGHISVYSEPGLGTTFKIWLPRANAEATRPASCGSDTQLRRGTETILLVEDDGSIRTLARLVLQGLGYTVLEAKHGAEALLVCQQHKAAIHLLATDLTMPNLSGPQLAKQIADLRPGIKVLYLSGYPDQALLQQGIITPNTPFLHKPFTAAELARLVRKVLDRPSA